MAWSNNWQERNLKQVSGVFDAPVELESLLIILDQRGFRQDVSVLMSDATREIYSSSYSYGGVEPVTMREVEEMGGGTAGNFSVNEQSKAPEGATTGGITGGVLGAFIGGLTMAGTLFIPGSSLLVVGPIIGMLTGGAVGGATGGVIGALIGAGIPEHEAKIYHQELAEEGKSLVVAHVPDDAVRDVKKIFKQCGAHQIKVAS